MSVVQQPSATGEYIVFRRRRGVELVLLMISCSFGLGGWIISHLNLHGALPPDLVPAACIWYGMALVAHLVVRWKVPYADPVILPAVMLLNGLGLAMIARLDQVTDPVGQDAAKQLIWTGLGLVLFIAVLVFLRDHRRLVTYNPIQLPLIPRI